MNVRAEWVLSPCDRKVTEEFSRELNVPFFFARLLMGRGITSVSEAADFLNPRLESLHDPFMMKDMRKGTERIKKAISAGEKICVYGDYDADGISGTAVLVLALRRLGAKVSYHIPHRFKEGYGLKENVIKDLWDEGVRLIVTVDTGITAFEEVAFAGSLGLDVIITDHHRPFSDRPAAYAVINPKQEDCSYPFKELAGVGVAFKVSQALADIGNESLAGSDANLDLVALGTVADLVPLRGENRIIVRYGLKSFPMTDRVGIRALGEISGVNLRNIDVSHLGYRFAPRINAAGRMGDATRGLHLLLSDDIMEARGIVSVLNEENKKRQKIERAIVKNAREMVGEENNKDIIILSSPQWHRGAIGIAASRLVDRYNRPVIMIALEEGLGYASARSLDGVDIFNLLDESSDLLVTYGGHYYAAGFTVQAEKIDELSGRIEEAVSSLSDSMPEMLVPKLRIDSIMDPDELETDALKRCLGMLAPFGKENSAPVFASEDVFIADPPLVVGNNHLKLSFSRGGDRKFEAIGFGMGDMVNEIEEGRGVDIAFTPWFRNDGNLEIRLQDIKIKN